MSTPAAYNITGPRGATVGINLKLSKAWRNYVEWLAKSPQAPSGWVLTTTEELARVLYPVKWNDGNRAGDDATHKTQTFRYWVIAGLTVDSGMRDYQLGKVKRFGVGLTMRGVAASHDIGIRNVPPAVAVTPSAPLRVTVPEPAMPLQTGDYLNPVPEWAPARGHGGPPAEVRQARATMLREVRDALTLAAWALDHPVKCEKQHVDDLSAEELFDLAVAKAKAGK